VVQLKKQNLPFVFLLTTILATTLSYADHDGSRIQAEIITGEVVFIDRENSNVTIKYKTNKDSKDYDSIVLLISKATIISRYGMKVGLYSLSVGDSVEMHIEKKPDKDDQELRKAIIIEIRRSTNTW